MNLKNNLLTADAMPLETFENLTRLTHLDLSHNPLVRYPDALYNPSLRPLVILGLMHSSLRALPANAF